MVGPWVIYEAKSMLRIAVVKDLREERIGYVIVQSQSQKEF